jgi:hypothetical protein
VSLRGRVALRLALVAVLMLTAGCARAEGSGSQEGTGRARAGREQGGPGSDTTASDTTAVALRLPRVAAPDAATSASSATGAARNQARAPDALAGAEDRVECALRDGRILALTLAPARPTAVTFRATLAGPSTEPPRTVTVSLATDSAPVDERRPLAFYRLAAALGMHVVPAAVARPVSVGEIGALLDGQPSLLAMVRREVRVQNDGRVDALLTAPLPSSLPCPWCPVRASSIALRGSAEAALWERWACSNDAAPNEHARLLRDFVEALVLDYLAAFETRGEALYLHAEDALALTDNRGAFPLRPDADLVAIALRRLRGVARFPRGLRSALTRLDRARAAETLAPGGFDTWLVPPRSLLDLDERRASLLSLLDARIAERGAERVLCL